MSRKVLLNLAVSLDGYIAREDGSYDWIGGDGSERKTRQQFHFEAFLANCDAILMGRHSFEIIDPKEYHDQKIYVFTHHPKEDYDNVHFITEDPKQFVAALKKKKQMKNIYLFGGASLVNQLLPTGLIDEYIIGVIPMLLGKGIRLFEGHEREQALMLYNHYLDQGIMILHYVPRGKEPTNV
ncbi:MAG: dihydrofolate reductase family protein [Erysipelotrichaceae bacterium]